MQFRAEGFNISNTPHFANPNANVSSATITNGIIGFVEQLQPDHGRQPARPAPRRKILPLRCAIHILSYGNKDTASARRPCCLEGQGVRK